MKIRLLLCLLILFQVSIYASTNTKNAHQLAVRIMGEEKAGRIIFKDVKSDKDIFTISSKGNNIIISGNSSNSMAMGLGHYLKYFCLSNVSWDADDSITLPTVLPIPETPITREARVENRFFLNYCTFGYSMVWWQWREWEHFIDWMALNGINLPLAITGQESVWYKVWREMGLSDLEIRSYFTGPAHLPWHRMINLDHWQGPLPMSWITHQEALQQKIVARERQLGMRPVLPAFAGHVPEALKRLYPEAKISRMSSWGGFRDDYRSFFLAPNDPLFNKIQQAFMKEQRKLYGTDHVYGVDPFNEVDPPSWEPEFLKDAGRTIYESLTQNDPKAVWVQMTWLFYIDQGHWTKPRIEAFLSAIPKHKLVLLDYFAENTEVWKRTDSYYGQDFVWCYLGNFGGNTMLAGNLRETGQRIENALANAGANISGIGSTLEAFDCNPIMYEYVLDKAWTPILDDEQWVKAWAYRRAGRQDDEVAQAWQLLIDSVYTTPAALGQAPLTNARPTFKGHGNWTTNPRYNYNNELLGNIWTTFKRKAATRSLRNDALRFDAANIGRQYLSNSFLELRDKFTTAYNAKDTLTMNSIIIQAKVLFAKLEQTLAFHPFFSFNRWIKGAEAFGTDKESRAYFRSNAATLLTTWGESPQSLNDYASRTWSDLVSQYYAVRWIAFFEEAAKAAANDKEFNQQEFNQRLYLFERNFAGGKFSLPNK